MPVIVMDQVRLQLSMTMSWHSTVIVVCIMLLCDCYSSCSANSNPCVVSEVPLQLSATRHSVTLSVSESESQSDSESQKLFSQNYIQFVKYNNYCNPTEADLGAFSVRGDFEYQRTYFCHPNYQLYVARSHYGNSAINPSREYACSPTERARFGKWDEAAQACMPNGYPYSTGTSWSTHSVWFRVSEESDHCCPSWASSFSTSREPEPDGCFLSETQCLNDGVESNYVWYDFRDRKHELKDFDIFNCHEFVPDYASVAGPQGPVYPQDELSWLAPVKYPTSAPVPADCRIFGREDPSVWGSISDPRWHSQKGFEAYLDDPNPDRCSVFPSEEAQPLRNVERCVRQIEELGLKLYFFYPHAFATQQPLTMVPPVDIVMRFDSDIPYECLSYSHRYREIERGDYHLGAPAPFKLWQTLVGESDTCKLNEPESKIGPDGNHVPAHCHDDVLEFLPSDTETSGPYKLAHGSFNPSKFAPCQWIPRSKHQSIGHVHCRLGHDFWTSASELHKFDTNSNEISLTVSFFSDNRVWTSLAARAPAFKLNVPRVVDVFTPCGQQPLLYNFIDHTVSFFPKLGRATDSDPSPDIELLARLNVVVLYIRYNTETYACQHVEESDNPSDLQTFKQFSDLPWVCHLNMLDIVNEVDEIEFFTAFVYHTASSVTRQLANPGAYNWKALFGNLDSYSELNDYAYFYQQSAATQPFVFRFKPVDTDPLGRVASALFRFQPSSGANTPGAAVDMGTTINGCGTLAGPTPFQAQRRIGFGVDFECKLCQTIGRKSPFPFLHGDYRVGLNVGLGISTGGRVLVAGDASVSGTVSVGSTTLALTGSMLASFTLNTHTDGRIGLVLQRALYDIAATAKFPTPMQLPFMRKLGLESHYLVGGKFTWEQVPALANEPGDDGLFKEFFLKWKPSRSTLQAGIVLSMEKMLPGGVTGNVSLSGSGSISLNFPQAPQQNDMLIHNWAMTIEGSATIWPKWAPNVKGIGGYDPKFFSIKRGISITFRWKPGESLVPTITWKLLREDAAKPAYKVQSNSGADSVSESVASADDDHFMSWEQPRSSSDFYDSDHKQTGPDSDTQSATVTEQHVLFELEALETQAAYTLSYPHTAHGILFLSDRVDKTDADTLTSISNVQVRMEDDVLFRESDAPNVTVGRTDFRALSLLLSRDLDEQAEDEDEDEDEDKVMDVLILASWVEIPSVESNTPESVAAIADFSAASVRVSTLPAPCTSANGAVTDCKSNSPSPSDFTSPITLHTRNDDGMIFEPIVIQQQSSKFRSQPRRENGPDAAVVWHIREAGLQLPADLNGTVDTSTVWMKTSSRTSANIPEMKWDAQPLQLLHSLPMNLLTEDVADLCDHALIDDLIFSLLSNRSHVYLEVMNVSSARLEHVIELPSCHNQSCLDTNGSGIDVTQVYLEYMPVSIRVEDELSASASQPIPLSWILLATYTRGMRSYSVVMSYRGMELSTPEHSHAFSLEDAIGSADLGSSARLRVLCADLLQQDMHSVIYTKRHWMYIDTSSVLSNLNALAPAASTSEALSIVTNQLRVAFAGPGTKNKLNSSRFVGMPLASLRRHNNEGDEDHKRIDVHIHSLHLEMVQSSHMCSLVDKIHISAVTQTERQGATWIGALERVTLSLADLVADSNATERTNRSNNTNTNTNTNETSTTDTAIGNMTALSGSRFSVLKSELFTSNGDPGLLSATCHTCDEFPLPSMLWLANTQQMIFVGRNASTSNASCDSDPCIATQETISHESQLNVSSRRAIYGIGLSHRVAVAIRQYDVMVFCRDFEASSNSSFVPLWQHCGIFNVTFDKTRENGQDVRLDYDDSRWSFSFNSNDSMVKAMSFNGQTILFLKQLQDKSHAVGLGNMSWEAYATTPGSRFQELVNPWGSFKLTVVSSTYSAAWDQFVLLLYTSSSSVTEMGYYITNITTSDWMQSNSNHSYPTIAPVYKFLGTQKSGYDRNVATAGPSNQYAYIFTWSYWLHVYRYTLAAPDVFDEADVSVRQWTVSHDVIPSSASQHFEVSATSRFIAIWHNNLGTDTYGGPSFTVKVFRTSTEQLLANNFGDFEPADAETLELQFFARWSLDSPVDSVDLVDISAHLDSEEAVGAVLYITLSKSEANRTLRSVHVVQGIQREELVTYEFQSADLCPNNTWKDLPGQCGCGIPDDLGTDTDGDGVLACVDNCPIHANVDQRDHDGDGIGDVCDLDIDNDGVLNNDDGCPFDSAKSIPGECGCGVSDADDDGDGIVNCKDRCVSVASMNQTDTDSDGVGDVCDNCPGIPNSNQTDTDGDGIGDLCDTDIDADGVLNQDDACPSAVELTTAHAFCKCDATCLRKVSWLRLLAVHVSGASPYVVLVNTHEEEAFVGYVAFCSTYTCQWIWIPRLEPHIPTMVFGTLYKLRLLSYNGVSGSPDYLILFSRDYDVYDAIQLEGVSAAFDQWFDYVHLFGHWDTRDSFVKIEAGKERTYVRIHTDEFNASAWSSSSILLQRIQVNVHSEKVSATIYNMNDLKLHFDSLVVASGASTRLLPAVSVAARSWHTFDQAALGQVGRDLLQGNDHLLLFRSLSTNSPAEIIDCVAFQTDSETASSNFTQQYLTDAVSAGKWDRLDSVVLRNATMSIIHRTRLDRFGSEAWISIADDPCAAENDVTPPNVMGRNVEVQLDSDGQASIYPSNVDDGSTDECGVGSMTVHPSSFSCTDIGNNTVTLTVIDSNSNAASVNVTVTVRDNSSRSSCDCSVGWTGQNCSVPICFSCPNNSRCVAPEVCQCHAYSCGGGSFFNDSSCVCECRNGASYDVMSSSCICEHSHAPHFDTSLQACVCDPVQTACIGNQSSLNIDTCQCQCASPFVHSPIEPRVCRCPLSRANCSNAMFNSATCECEAICSEPFVRQRESNSCRCNASLVPCHGGEVNTTTCTCSCPKTSATVTVFDANSSSCTCKPITSCEAQAVMCGSIYDGCTYVQCGVCPAGATCQRGHCASHCTPQLNQTCSNRECGTAFDGCEIKNCGRCADHGRCTYQGQCQSDCSPARTCQSEGAECGVVFDGCKYVQCGICSSRTTCEANSCNAFRCAPTRTCSSVARSCGYMFDGCQLADCGSCAAGTVCRQGTCAVADTKNNWKLVSLRLRGLSLEQLDNNAEKELFEASLLSGLKAVLRVSNRMEIVDTAAGSVVVTVKIYDDDGAPSRQNGTSASADELITILALMLMDSKSAIYTNPAAGVLRQADPQYIQVSDVLNGPGFGTGTSDDDDDDDDDDAVNVLLIIIICVLAVAIAVAFAAHYRRRGYICSKLAPKVKSNNVASGPGKIHHDGRDSHDSSLELGTLTVSNEEPDDGSGPERGEVQQWSAAAAGRNHDNRREDPQSVPVAMSLVSSSQVHLNIDAVSELHQVEEHYDTKQQSAESDQIHCQAHDMHHFESPLASPASVSLSVPMSRRGGLGATNRITDDRPAVLEIGDQQMMM
jgi:Thrombospondin type 3 repeat